MLNMVAKPMFRDGLGQVVFYRGTVSDGLGSGPGFEVKAEGMHVAVGANPRILK